MAGYVNNQVYWVGADGNIYLRNGSNVSNMGKAINVGGGGFDAAHGSAEASQIADPNPPQASTPAPSSPNGASGGGTQTADKSNDIALQLAGLGAVGQQQDAGMSSIDKALGRLKGQYATEATANEANYTGQSNTNQNNLQKNKQTAYVNAAQGRQGLFGTLASLGALNGSGIDLATQAVQKGANNDLAGAADNYSTNQQGLDTAIGTFRQQDKQRNENADTAAENARTNVKNQAAQSRMAFLGNLANDYAAEGNSAQAKSYSDQAAALYPTLASTSVPNADLTYSGAAFTPGTLANYLAGSNSTQVSSTPTQGGQGIPGLVAAPAKKKQLQPA